MGLTLARALSRRGMQVHICADGAAAVKAWQAARPDAVLLDLTLPGRDGLDVLADARALGLETPVLMLTARGTVGDRVLGLNAGADDYLPKPFDLDELEARVRAMVRAATRGHHETIGGDDNFGALRHDGENGAFYLRGVLLELGFGRIANGLEDKRPNNKAASGWQPET